MLNASPPSDIEGADSVDMFCKRFDVSRATFYREVAAGRLDARKVGGKTLVPRKASQAWLEGLPKLVSTVAA